MKPNSPSGSPGHQAQDLVVGLAPLKLMQNSLLPPTKDMKVDTVNEHSVGEEEFRSLQLEHLKFAEERGEGKELASFPLTYRRRHEAKRQLHQQIAEKRKVTSMLQSHQRETKEEEQAWRELQQRVHTLEHVYNQECFLKVYIYYTKN